MKLASAHGYDLHVDVQTLRKEKDLPGEPGVAVAEAMGRKQGAREVLEAGDRGVHREAGSPSQGWEKGPYRHGDAPWVNVTMLKMRMECRHIHNPNITRQLNSTINDRSFQQQGRPFKAFTFPEDTRSLLVEANSAKPRQE